MGTHCCTEPLTGLELNLSVHVVYIKIPIAWERKKKKDTFQTIFVDCETNHVNRRDEKRAHEFRSRQSFIKTVPLCADIKHLEGTRRLFSL